MTKKLKSALSLLLALTMLLSMMPAVPAAVKTDLSPAISLFGTEDSNTAALNDNYFFTVYEADKLTDKTLASNLGKVVKFTNTDSGIQFDLGGEETVKRIDLWILSVGGIKNYRVLTSADGNDWASEPVVMSDAFPVYDGTVAASEDTPVASYYPIVFDEAVTASHLRFVIDSFADNSNTAYISEAKIYDTNEINLGEHQLLYDKNTFPYKNASPYLADYNSSTTYAWKRDVTTGDGIMMWPYYTSGTGNHQMIRPDFTSADGEGTSPIYDKDSDSNGVRDFWYSTDFGRSKVKVNRIGITIDSKADSTVCITEFEVYAFSECGTATPTTGDNQAQMPTSLAANEGKYTKLATINCNLTKETDSVLFDIPNAVEANGYMINITGHTGFTYKPTNNYYNGIESVEMYAVSDSEISNLAKATENFFDKMLTPDVDSTTASEKIEGLGETDYTFDGNNYTVLWSDDSEFVDDEGNISFHRDEEEVTITAKISSADDTSVSYYLEKTYTLAARENVLTVKVSNNETDILTDGFLFSAYDREKESNINAAEHPERFEEITDPGTIIEYNWLGEDKVKRLDLWVYPAGSVKEYEIQTYDGSAWNTISGNIDENVDSSAVAPENHAVYYPILFDEVSTNKMRLVIKSLGEGISKAYIAEAMPSNTHSIDFASSPAGAEGSDTAYSHYIKSYIVSNTSDEDPAYRKSQTAVWPVYSEGTSPSVTPNSGEVWYATGFSTLPVKFNHIVVPFIAGSAKEIELLCAEGEESGFDMTSDYPAAPDTIAQWKTVATVRGSFSSSNPAVIDLTSPPVSGYWMIRVKNASSSMSLGRPEFYLVDSSEFSPLAEIADAIFTEVETDTADPETAKTNIILPASYTYGEGTDEKLYTVEWESSSDLLDVETGEISEHESDENATLTAIITDPDNTSISYCVSKEFILEGMLKVSVFKGAQKERDSGILTDKFYYTRWDIHKDNPDTVLQDPKNAYYNPDKFVHFDSLNSGFEFYWEKPKVLKRLELWAWPADSISSYEIQVSSDGESWSTHYTGTIEDQYASDPDSRPEDTADAAGSAVFYPIVFDSPTEPVKYVRFVITGLRNEVQGAYIAEAYFKETNDVNYIGLGSIEGLESHKSYKTRSKYTAGFYLSDTQSDTASYRRAEVGVWPVYSSSGVLLTINASPTDICYYSTSFQGAPVAINKATVTVKTGEILEYEVMCAETLTSGFHWADYPTRPDTRAAWRTVARVSGKFGAGTHEIHFDNDFKSKYWMIKFTEASDDLAVSGAGLYTLAKSELNSSSFVLDSVFDNVSDTAIDNVIKEKMNMPSSLEIGGKSYDVIWGYDETMVNADGTLIPALTDREMVLKARIGASEDGYKHVLEKTYYLLGHDDRARTALYSGENLSLVGAGEQICSAALDHGFSFDGKKELEIDFAELNTGGKLSLMAGDSTVLTLSVKNGEIIANEGTDSETAVAYTEKIRVDIEGDAYSLYKYDNGIYTAVIYNGALLLAASPDAVKLSCSEGETLAIDTMAVNAASTELFDAIEEQFVFSKISPAYRATNLNADLTLINKVSDTVGGKITFSYSSGAGIDVTTDPAIGDVDLTSSAETYITVTATGSDAQDSFTKTFNVITGKDNVFAKAKSASPASGLDGKTADMAADGDLESEFVTSSQSYRINIDLQETKAFNKIRIIEADTEAKIQEYTISVSDNNVDFTEIHTGTQGINSSELITVPYSEARFIRINFKANGSGTGIRDICAYNEMSDSDKLDYDYKATTQNLAVKNGTVISKTGRFGTKFTLTSSDSAVTITETADKTGWKVNVGSSNSEKNVTVTLTAENGTATPKTSTYTITVLASTAIGTVISGGGNAGTGGSSGGAAPSVAITPVPTENLYANDELAGHWGANEIKTLIARGIVEGDGSSLNLDSKVTRAEFCKMIVTGFGYEPAEYRGSFHDVKSDDWFAPFVETAFEHGIMSGDERGFRPNDTITRQEMAMVLINVLKAQLPDVTCENEVSFTDDDAISHWAKEAVKLAAGLKLLNGYDTGDFKPLQDLRRDEAMVVVYRVLSHIGK